MKSDGRTAIAARYSDPGSVRRVRTRSRDCAGGGRCETRREGVGLRGVGGAGPDAGYVPAVLPEVVRLVDGVELDRRVEVREDDDECALEQQVAPVAGREIA